MKSRPSLAALFERAFNHHSAKPGGRPTAKQWYAALAELRLHLQKCPADAGHRFSSMLAVCPWCKIMRQSGPNFFSSVTVYRTTASSFEVSAAARESWAEIEAVTLPPPVRPAAPRRARVQVRSPPASVRDNRFLVIVVRCAMLVSSALAVASAWFIEMAPIAWLLLAGLVSWSAYLERSSLYAKERRRRRQEAAGWEEDLRRAAAEWKSLALHYGTEFEVAKMKLTGVRDELQNLRAGLRRRAATIRAGNVRPAARRLPARTFHQRSDHGLRRRGMDPAAHLLWHRDRLGRRPRASPKCPDAARP